MVGYEVHGVFHLFLSHEQAPINSVCSGGHCDWYACVLCYVFLCLFQMPKGGWSSKEDGKRYRFRDLGHNLGGLQ